jgi:hypothetical protein
LRERFAVRLFHDCLMDNHVHLLVLFYNVWYRGLGDEPAPRQQRWRAFLLGDDPREEVARRGDWTVGDDAYRRRMQQAGARPARRRGRPRKPPPGQQGYVPEFYAEAKDP